MTIATQGTYTDGTGAVRCSACFSKLRAGGEPVVSIPMKDAELLARMVQKVLDGTAQVDEPTRATYGELVHRLEQTVGRTLRQMEAD